MEIKEAIKIINQYDMNFHWNDGEPIPAEQLAEAFDLAISALEKQEQDRWIPVTERPSEKYKDVLVTDREVSDVYVSHYCGGGYWPTDTGCANNRIIAWRPLPEPYQEKES